VDVRWDGNDEAIHASIHDDAVGEESGQEVADGRSEAVVMKI